MSTTPLHPDMSALLTAFLNRAGSPLGKVASAAGKRLANEARLQMPSTFDRYLTHLLARVTTVKTIISFDSPQYLYSFYVPLDLANDDFSIKAAGIEDCLRAGNRLFVTGFGGSGKTTLFRHLVVSSLHNTTRIPFVLQLRAVPFEDATLRRHLFVDAKKDAFPLDDSALELLLKRGDAIVFLDGFDEISHNMSLSAQQQILDFARQYPQTPIFISSRPDLSEASWESFTHLQTQPLTLRQALNLVRMLKYDDTVKHRFAEALQAGMFEQYQSFLSNPLLLTIMLINYAANAEVPHKAHLFYAQVFDTMWNRHDATKASFRRDRFTSLAMDDFIKCLSAFAAQIYLDETYAFLADEAYNYAKNASKLVEVDVDPEKFIRDLTTSLCILAQDGFTYSFTHRSFLEYYTASYLGWAPTKIVRRLGDALLARGWRDSALALAFDMNRDIVENNIIIPLLDNVSEMISGARGDPDEAALCIAKRALAFLESYDGSISWNTKDSVLESLTQVASMYAKHGVQFPELRARSDRFDPTKYKPVRITTPEEFEEHRKFVLDTLYASPFLYPLIDLPQFVEKLRSEIISRQERMSRSAASVLFPGEPH